MLFLADHWPSVWNVSQGWIRTSSSKTKFSSDVRHDFPYCFASLLFQFPFSRLAVQWATLSGRHPPSTPLTQGPLGKGCQEPGIRRDDEVRSSTFLTNFSLGISTGALRRWFSSGSSEFFLFPSQSVGIRYSDSSGRPGLSSYADETHAEVAIAHHRHEARSSRLINVFFL